MSIVALMAAAGMVSFVVLEMAPMDLSMKEMDFGGGRSHDDFGNDNSHFRLLDL